MAQPFFNSNYGSSLMRVDNSGIQQAGQAYGQMFANLGKTIGSTIEKFREGKEKKEQQQRSEDLFLRQYESNPDNPIFSNLGIESIEEAKAVAKDISKDPKLVADAMKFGQMAMDQQKAQRDAELFNLRKSEILRSRRDKDLAQSDEQAIARFRTTRPDLPITKDTPASSLPPLDPDPFAAPPTTFKGQAPAVAQLPKSFQLEGKGIIDAVQSGRLSQTQGNRIMDSIQARAMAERKAALSPKDILDIQGKTLDMNIKNTDFGDSESIKTFKPESHYLQLGTTKMPISGRLGNEAEAIKYKDDYIPKFNQTNATFEKLLALGQKRADGWYMSSEDKDQALSYIKTLQGNIREDILGPGTVQESERVILDNIVKNPTEAFTLNGADANMEILRNLRQTIFDRLENRLGNFGLELGDSKSPNPSQAKPDYTDETSTGNKIRTFDFDNNNQ